MKIALVHDYLNEFGGAERVLESLSELYPKAPIYTAFYKEGSPAHKRFKHKKIVTSWAQRVPGFVDYLHSPLRFLAPQVWESFDFDKFDVVISSASWYITKGIVTSPDTTHVCYCHTPPRYLYGYPTSRNLQRFWPVRVYGALVNKQLREYDFLSAQRVDAFATNSENTRARIKKFYRKDAKVIFPPVNVATFSPKEKVEKEDYFLTGGRLVGAKHFDLIIKAAEKLDVPLKIYGSGPLEAELRDLAGGNVEFLGRVSDEKLVELYQRARAFVVAAEDEDFGITPVEAMAAGTPVVAYAGGGYKETVVEGKTGVFFKSLKVGAVARAIDKVLSSKFKVLNLTQQAEKFSEERFKKQISEFVKSKVSKNV